MSCNCNENTITIHVSANHGGGNTAEMVYTMSADSPLEELFSNFRAIALGLTYAPRSWDEVVLAAAEDVEWAKAR